MSDADPTPAFVDTNVLVYAHDEDGGEKATRAQALLGELWENGSGCVSVQVLQEFFVTTTRKLRRPLAPDAAAEYVDDFSRWKLHSPDREDLLAAIAIVRRHRLSLWDAMILRSASRLGCRILWTEDFKDGVVLEGVRVRNPFK